VIRLCVISATVVAVILGVARALSLGPYWELDDKGLWVCAGINLGVCWLAFVPMLIVVRRCPVFIPQAMMGAVVIRMLILVPVTLAVCIYGPWPAIPLMLWMLVIYLALLVVETRLVVKLMNGGLETVQGKSAS